MSVWYKFDTKMRFNYFTKRDKGTTCLVQLDEKLYKLAS